MSVGTFTSAKYSGDTFTDASSNDIILRTKENSQRLLVGFSSNTNSIIRFGSSNVWMGWSNISFSNLGTMSVTSNATVNHLLYSSNVYVGTPNTYSHSNFSFYVSGSGRIEGDLVVNGTITNVNTNVNVTDQFLVQNDGTGPALIVNQNGAQHVAEFKQNNNLVFIIANNTFVGIGSNTPTTKLDVQGNSTLRGDVYCSNIYASNSYIYSESVYTSNVYVFGEYVIGSNGRIQNSNYIPELDTTKIISGTFTSNFIHDRNIVTSKLDSNLSIGGFVFFDGFVNIGYSNSNYHPYRLQVNDGDVLIQGSNDFTSTSDQARINLGDSNYFIATSKNIGMLFQVSNTSYPMFIENNTGFVGIGTVDPFENLHVIGNTKISSNCYVLNSLSVNTSNALETFHVTAGNARLDSNLYVLNSISITSSNPSETFDVAGQHNAKIGSNMYVMNRIGIYTSNPSERLHVQDGKILVNERQSNIEATINIQHSSLQPFKLSQDDTGKGYLANPENELHITSSNIIRVYTGASLFERLFLNEFGVMGLGTNIPNENTILHIKDMENRSNAQIRIENAQGYCMTLGQRHFTGETYVWTECNLDMVFGTNNEERFKITSNCSFGFGTANPESFVHLHTSSNDHIMTVTMSDNANLTGLQITKSNTQDCVVMNTHSNAHLALGTSNVERLRIDVNGKVGIGIAAVGDRLEVQGNIRSSVGTLGPMIMLLPPITYTDVQVGSMLVLDNTIEAGNEISNNNWRPLFNSASFLYANNSGETMEWNFARLVFRGMSLTQSNNEISNMVVQEYYYDRVPQYSNITPEFTLSNPSMPFGYYTAVTPWFQCSSSNVRHLAIQLASSTYGSVYRFGSVYIQYKN